MIIICNKSTGMTKTVHFIFIVYGIHTYLIFELLIIIDTQYVDL